MLGAADPSFIAAAFAVIGAHPGDAEGFLRDELGLRYAGPVRLRSRYLTRV